MHIDLDYNASTPIAPEVRNSPVRTCSVDPAGPDCPRRFPQRLNVPSHPSVRRLALMVIAVCAAASPGGAAEPPTGDPKASPGPAVHDPAHAPIDCPLRRQGIDPTKLRPFEAVEKYIASRASGYKSHNINWL